ncbi:MAG TPA: hypothetical protein VMT69_09290 [Kineosporiaceae bacterium]|nr:hypothetical protein [Kineosporiaceae bacterium]
MRIVVVGPTDPCKGGVAAHTTRMASALAGGVGTGSLAPGSVRSPR